MAQSRSHLSSTRLVMKRQQHTEYIISNILDNVIHHIAMLSKDSNQDVPVDKSWGNLRASYIWQRGCHYICAHLFAHIPST
eukprot:scaffold208910_cov20-Prasinocladus_malaysianus.AAC.1